MNSIEYKRWLVETPKSEKERLRKEINSKNFFGTFLDWINTKK